MSSTRSSRVGEVEVREGFVFLCDHITEYLTILMIQSNDYISFENMLLKGLNVMRWSNQTRVWGRCTPCGVTPAGAAEAAEEVLHRRGERARSKRAASARSAVRRRSCGRARGELKNICSREFCD